jgi:hemoglobin-like flavoprotein
MDKQKDFEKGWEDYKTKRKQQTEEMIGVIQKSVGGCARHWASLIAEELIKYYQPKIPEGGVVLTEGEYSDMLSAEVETIERDIAEYWANEDVESVAKELHKDGYRKLDDHAILVLRKAKGLEEKVRKETAEKYHAEMVKAIESVPNATKEFVEAWKAKNDEIAKEITEGENG